MPFELNDKDHSSALCDIDPDLHFYQEFNQATVKCNYHLDTNFLKREFTVIALTETWLNDNDCDLYGLSGNLTERGNQQNARNVLIGVIYRPSNQDILLFNEKLNNVMNDVRMENKICYLLGDYNVDILNYFSHVHTVQFADMMSSSTFLHLITRPTRVTATSATLIDNIFTNYLEDISHSIQGLDTTDASDHFQIFHISRGMQMSVFDTHVCRRLYSLRNKEEFCHDISTTYWDETNRATDTQQAFDLFHNRLTELYNRHSQRSG